MSAAIDENNKGIVYLEAGHCQQASIAFKNASVLLFESLSLEEGFEGGPTGPCGGIGQAAMATEMPFLVPTMPMPTIVPPEPVTTPIPPQHGAPIVIEDDEDHGDDAGSVVSMMDDGENEKDDDNTTNNHNNNNNNDDPAVIEYDNVAPDAVMHVPGSTRAETRRGSIDGRPRRRRRIGTAQGTAHSHATTNEGRVSVEPAGVTNVFQPQQPQQTQQTQQPQPFPPQSSAPYSGNPTTTTTAVSPAATQFWEKLRNPGQPASSWRTVGRPIAINNNHQHNSQNPDSDHDDSQQHTVTAVIVLYNLALSFHLEGILHSTVNRRGCLDKALSVYTIATKLAMRANLYSTILLVTLHNMGQIQQELFGNHNAQQLTGIMSQVLRLINNTGYEISMVHLLATPSVDLAPAA